MVNIIEWHNNNFYNDRHIVFTISNYLWDLFKIDRKRLNLLFEAASKILLEKDIGKDKFKTIKNLIYKKSNNGFYVYSEKKNNPSTQNMIEYAVRYTGKPAMAESRILDYDNYYVTFWYQRHKDNQVVVDFYFIKRLIIYIPDENFKTVRYYGIYARKHKFHNKMVMLINKQIHKIRNSIISWRMMLLRDFDFDPLSCPKCGNQMKWQYRVCYKGCVL